MIRDGREIIQLSPEEVARVLDAHDAGKLKAFGVKTEEEVADGRGCLLQVGWGCLFPLNEGKARGIDREVIENTLAKFDYLYDPQNGAPRMIRRDFRQLLERAGFAKVTS